MLGWPISLNADSRFERPEQDSLSDNGPVDEIRPPRPLGRRHLEGVEQGADGHVDSGKADRVEHGFCVETRCHLLVECVGDPALPGE